MKHLNFGRNVTLTPRSLCTPKSEQEVIEILDQSNGKAHSLRRPASFLEQSSAV